MSIRTNFRKHHHPDMILRNKCLRTLSLRTFHTSSSFNVRAPRVVSAAPTPPTSIAAPFPPKTRPEGNDPNYIHPPSSVKAGTAMKGLQILRDQPDIVAQPDDFYPDWLWE